jgi:hypothetical protein
MSLKKLPQVSLTGSHFTPEMRTLCQILEISKAQSKQTAIDLETLIASESNTRPLMKFDDVEIVSDPCTLYM